ncbi:MAG: flagellar hook-length control protein FliK [Pseudomonadota bacterium]
MPDMLGVGTAQPRLNLTGAATPAQAQPLANAWKVGEILQATVLGASGAGMTKLDINGLEVSTKAPIPLAEGDRLELQVSQPGPPPQLRIMRHQSGEQAPLDQALRQALPKGGDPQLLSRLGEMLKTLGDAPELPESQRQALRQLHDALPSLRQLTDPGKLEQQVRASGLFLENDLAFRGQPQEGDLKAALLRVLASLQTPPASTQAGQTQVPPAPTPPAQPLASQPSTPPAAPPGSSPQGNLPAPPSQGMTINLSDGRQSALDTYRSLSNPDQAPARDTTQTMASRGNPLTVDMPSPVPQSSLLADNLKQAVEGALARLHLNQLTSLQAQNSEQPHWVMEFPLPADQGDTALRLRLEREGARKGSGETGEPGWRLDFDFSLEPLGPLRASVLMRGEHLNVRLWAERPATLDTLRDNLELLHAGLQRTGLEVDHLGCYPGQPIQRENETPRPSGTLLNLST